MPTNAAYVTLHGQRWVGGGWCARARGQPGRERERKTEIGKREYVRQEERIERSMTGGKEKHTRKREMVNVVQKKEDE